MNRDTVRIDLVDEASAESFPASDPPAFTGLHLGAPLHADELEAEPPLRDAERWLRRIAVTQGALSFAVGLWPLVHVRSFEAVTGKLRHRRMLQASGAMLACAGVALLLISRSSPIETASTP